MLEPGFFLASLPKGWEPRVVTVSNGYQVVGILYARERVIKGIRSGVVYVDGSLGDTVLSDPPHHKNVLRVAAETLLASKIYGIRIRVRRGSREIDAIRGLIASRPLDFHYSRIRTYNDCPFWRYDAHLTLGDSYEQFLTALGSTTRHNFRYYRRVFERAGHSLIENPSMDEFRSATIELAAKSKFQPPQSVTERHLNMVAATRRPLIYGLKHRNGEWVSVIGGWPVPGGAVLLFQHNNDRDFGKDSLSVVLRGYYIESLIRQGLKELVIMDGTGPPLSRYAKNRSTLVFHLDAPTWRWRTARFLISRIGPRLPAPLAEAALTVA